MLKQRIVTALILIPVFLFLLFFSSPTIFCICTALITLGAAWEWSNLMEIKKRAYRFLYLAIAAYLMYACLFCAITTILYVAFAWWVIAALLVITYQKSNYIWAKSFLLRGVMGLLVLVPCWVSLNYIRNQADGISSLLFLFILIWSADIAAYFAGKKWGKTKLAPIVSPGKSVQGLIGALISAIFITLIALWLSHVSLFIWPYAISLSLITVLFSIVGDLFESMLKRNANLKDSGKLLPGHGGLLDRIDSLTAAAPVFSVGALLLGFYLG